MPTILFVDDHPIYLDAVRRTLEQEILGLTVRTANGHRAALDAMACHDIDMCLADYRLPDGDGLSLLLEIKKTQPSVALGLLCADLTPSLATEARAVGAVLCLSKDKTSSELVAAIEIALAGGRLFDFGSEENGGLSLRRREILIYASQGLMDKQIGERLGVTESTVRAHWARIFEQLRVANRTEAVTRALRQRLI